MGGWVLPGGLFGLEETAIRTAMPAMKIGRVDGPPPRHSGVAEKKDEDACNFNAKGRRGIFDSKYLCERQPSFIVFPSVTRHRDGELHKCLLCFFFWGGLLYPFVAMEAQQWSPEESDWLLS